MNTLGDTIHLRNLPTFAPLLGLEPPEWTLAAVCASTDPEIFHPEKGGSSAPAKAVCAGCTVRTECLQYALDRSERFGIWGGLSERERRKIATPAERARRRTAPRYGDYRCPESGCERVFTSAQALGPHRRFGHRVVA